MYILLVIYSGIPAIYLNINSLSFRMMLLMGLCWFLAYLKPYLHFIMCFFLILLDMDWHWHNDFRSLRVAYDIFKSNCLIVEVWKECN